MKSHREYINEQITKNPKFADDLAQAEKEVGDGIDRNNGSVATGVAPVKDVTLNFKEIEERIMAWIIQAYGSKEKYVEWARGGDWSEFERLWEKAHGKESLRSIGSRR